MVALTISSCSKELTKESAMEKLKPLDEFSHPYYAPLQVGEMVLTDDGHTSSEHYIQQNYGTLIAAGLLQVDNSVRNSWRTVLKVELTPQGIAMSDPRRANATTAYVQVCRMIPDSIEKLEVIDPDQTIDCHYRFTETDITPFGRHLGFSDGRIHRDKLRFVRNTGWNVARPTATKPTNVTTPIIDTTETPIGEK